MTRPISMGLLTGLVLALVAAANHRRAAEVRIDPATMAELSRRLDLAVSGASSTLPPLPLASDVSEGKRQQGS